MLLKKYFITFECIWVIDKTDQREHFLIDVNVDFLSLLERYFLGTPCGSPRIVARAEVNINSCRVLLAAHLNSQRSAFGDMFCKMLRFQKNHNFFNSSVNP